MYDYRKIELSLKKISKIFPNAFIKLRTEELILDIKRNIFFRLDNIETNLDFDCKIIAYLSRPSHKGLTKKEHSYFLKCLNKYFNQNWTFQNMSLIYTYLGNDANRRLCKKFIRNDFNLEIIGEGINNGP
jgi:hypothetical protein